MTSHALYAGSFDPPTRGHLDIIRRGLRLFGQVTVAVGHNVEKRPLFSAAERVAMIEGALPDEKGLAVRSFEGLVVDLARDVGATVLLRGLRSISDFESEFRMALTNAALSNDVETVFLAPSESYAFLSSRLVKEVVAAGGSLDRFLTPEVALALKTKMEERT